MPLWLSIVLLVVLLCVGCAIGFAAGRRRVLSAPAPISAPTDINIASRLVAVMHPAAVVIDSGDVLVLANDAAQTMGVARDGRLVVRELLEISREVRRDGPLKRDIELSASLSRSSGLLTVGVDAFPLGEDGSIGLVLNDVTEARRLEAVRRDFVANVSHELKTPVGALTLLAEAIQDAAEDPEAVHRFGARMQHEGVRLGRLVQELIELSRLQGGEPMPPLKDVSVESVVAEALDRTRLAADAKDITLVAQGDPELVIPAVEAQVATAMTNLLANAVAYSPSGTRIAVGYRAHNGYAEISVSDEGIGIPGADLARIFERFYRVDPARSSATGGTGLGLAIVKHVATNHGGSVDVWSVVGKGSTFTLRLHQQIGD